MQIRTVLAKIIKGEHTGQIMNVIELVILHPGREQLTVYANELTQEDFNLLKQESVFCVLERRHNAQLEHISLIIKPFAAARLKDSL
jgi:hypothetical protein